MTDAVAAARGRPTGRAVHLRYEAAGLTVYADAVPWNADAVVVEVILRLPPAARHKADFALKIPGRPAAAPDAFRPDDADPGRFRLLFRVAVPPASTAAELLWKQKLLATVPVPVRTESDFLGSIKLANPTLAVRIGGRAVAAQTFVAAQCRGLTAAAVVTAPGPLAPLADVGLRVVFRFEPTAAEYDVPVPLTAGQLGQTSALVTASPPKVPRRAGAYSAAWFAGDRPLGILHARAVTAAAFAASLRVSDARFVVSEDGGPPRAVRHAPTAGPDGLRVGPCFVVRSREPGAAGLVTLRVAAVPAGPLAADREVLVTDGPTLVAPGLLGPADLVGVSAFELRHGPRVLGSAALHPVPAAAFTAEGGYKPPPDFAWTPTADDELGDRLLKLMHDPDAKR